MSAMPEILRRLGKEKQAGVLMARGAVGFRVDLKLADSSGGGFIEYTAIKIPVTLEMAEALGRGLKRQGAAGRIVEVPGEKIVEEWGAR
jgi:hypothetical protein